MPYSAPIHWARVALRYSVREARNKLFAILLSYIWVPKCEEPLFSVVIDID